MKSVSCFFQPLADREISYNFELLNFIAAFLQFFAITNVRFFLIFRKKFGKTKKIVSSRIEIGIEFSNMRIISKSTLVAFYTRVPQSKTALEEWYETTKKAEWSCFADIKKTFNSVDAVGNQRYVFNIKSNDYRLIVLIQFTPKTVYIRFVGTHKEYDAIKNIQKI